ncbi:GNAT family N-acetyltransferase [Epilithonimonas sp. UC225_85]|uniref:GNAT family N-acetyltransferase n=1 Tax=Epilithonimonas sp. UC225_85 TaxID=3350167 RepID=UPI0036D20D89
MSKTYETERLIIKPVDINDAEFMMQLVNTEKWLRYIGDRNIHNLEDAEKYVREKNLPQIERLGFGNCVVILKSNQEKIGTVGLYDREGIEGVDIGFAYLEAYEGKGYAYEAARKIMDIGINEFGIKKVSAITLPENFSSIRLIEKLGLKFKEVVRIPNDDVDLNLYELVL